MKPPKKGKTQIKSKFDKGIIKITLHSNHLNEEVLSCLNVLLCNDESFYNFLKLAVKSAKKFIRSWEKGMKFHNDSVKYIKQYFSQVSQSKM